MTVIKHADRDRLTRNAIVLDLGDIRRTAEAMESSARAKARSIIDDATAERARILAGAHEQGFAEGRTAGDARGLIEGRERGRAEAIETTKLEAAQTLDAWTKALDLFESKRDELLLDARGQVLALAITIAERVIKRRIETDPTVVADQLAAALALTVNPSRLSIRTSPDDLETAKTILTTLLQRFTTSPNVTIEPDPDLPRGSVILRTDNGEVDATIETQLDRIVEMILPAKNKDSHRGDTESTEEDKKKGVGSGE